MLSGGREAVKTVWQTANLVRKEGFGAAVRSSIEDPADWAEVERPDLARVTPDGRVVILFSDIEESTALDERIGDRTWVKLIGAGERDHEPVTLTRDHVPGPAPHQLMNQGIRVRIGTTWGARCGTVTICSAATSQ